MERLWRMSGVQNRIFFFFTGSLYLSQYSALNTDISSVSIVFILSAAALQYCEKKKTTHLDILSSFCIGFWTKALHCWFGFICYHTATHCLGTALLWIITKWLWEGAEHLGVKANCCVLYIIIGLSAPFAQWHGSSLRLALEKGACLNTPSEVIRW